MLRAYFEVEEEKKVDPKKLDVFKEKIQIDDITDYIKDLNSKLLL